MSLKKLVGYIREDKCEEVLKELEQLEEEVKDDFPIFHVALYLQGYNAFHSIRHLAQNGYDVNTIKGQQKAPRECWKEIYEYTKEGKTALNLALENPRDQSKEQMIELAQLLLELGAKVNAADVDIAIKKGYDGLIYELFDRCEDVNKHHHHKLPLHAACYVGDHSLLRYFLDSGRCDVNAVTDCSALSYSLRYRQGQAAKVLLEYGADVNIKPSWYYNTTLIAAVSIHDVEVFRRILASFNDVNMGRRSQQGTALHVAVENRRLDILEVLLERDDLDINVEKRNGDTALVKAIQGRAGPCIRELIKSGADVNRGPVKPLELVLELKDLIMAEVLLTAGVDLKHINWQQGSDLAFAAKVRSWQTVVKPLWFLCTIIVGKAAAKPGRSFEQSLAALSLPPIIRRKVDSTFASSGGIL